MNCKNCGAALDEHAKFCPSCGAKVVTQRLNFRQMMGEFFRNVVGLDNTYLKTVKTMALSPSEVLNDFTSGVRKRYFAPFGFFAIGAAISLFAFNQFSDEYIAMSNSMNRQQFEVIDDLSPDAQLDAKELEEQLAETEKAQRFLLRYYNFFSFLLLPFYTLMAFIIFRKPYNFGEHLVANAYMQGITFHFSTLFFLLSLVINPALNLMGIGAMILYYTYAYGRWYRLSFGKSLLKLLLFLLLLSGVLISLSLIGGLIGYLYGRFSG